MASQPTPPGHVPPPEIAGLIKGWFPLIRPAIKPLSNWGYGTLGGGGGVGWLAIFGTTDRRIIFVKVKSFLVSRHGMGDPAGNDVNSWGRTNFALKKQEGRKKKVGKLGNLLLEDKKLWIQNFNRDECLWIEKNQRAKDVQRSTLLCFLFFFTS